METLDGTDWDVVIADTGFASSLLALSLSRSGKRVLHLDPNDFYGGAEAALSLADAEAWASRCAGQSDTSLFEQASVTRLDGHTQAKLSPSRAYSIALAPHLIYAKSNLVPALVSSQCHNQLDFQAVGSWFILESGSVEPEQRSLVRVPSSREDVFQDSTFDLKAKRSLMKFLRFVATYENHPEAWQDAGDIAFPTFLQERYGIPSTLHEPILALAMLPQTAGTTLTFEVLPRIARHLRSIGIFGPGFGAVLSKWGGLAEIAQVACRASAVGGGVYVLGKGIKHVGDRDQSSKTSIQLSDDEHISTAWLCGSAEVLRSRAHVPGGSEGDVTRMSKSVTIVSSPLGSLFPPTSEGGVIPAGAVVVVPPADGNEPPVHIFVHTADAGECPMNQSVIYASVALPFDPGYVRLEQAVRALLEGVNEQPQPVPLWRLQYQQRSQRTIDEHMKAEGGCISLPSLPPDLVLGDALLDSVKNAWQAIIGEDEDMFMKFSTREPVEDD